MLLCMINKKYTGHGVVDFYKGVRVNVFGDFCEYYRRLFEFDTYKTRKSQTPAFRSHISIILPAIHGEKHNLSLIKHLNKTKAIFYYDPANIVITTKNAWLPVELPVGSIIKRILDVKDRNFLGYHLTLFNFKNV